MTDPHAPPLVVPQETIRLIERLLVRIASEGGHGEAVHDLARQVEQALSRAQPAQGEALYRLVNVAGGFTIYQNADVAFRAANGHLAHGSLRLEAVPASPPAQAADETVAIQLEARAQALEDRACKTTLAFAADAFRVRATEARYLIPVLIAALQAQGQGEKT